MFGKNTYHDYIPHIPPSLQTRASNFVIHQTDNEMHLQYHHNMHNNIFPSPYLPTTNGTLLDTAALFNQDANYAWNGDFAAMAGPKKQIAAKKDRHSKIYTAQGPRDRRVRLSIDIARKFFDLQEMLGFDKPSKTLDWLLSKSKAAIQELLESKAGNNKCVSNCSSQEEVLSPSENCNSFGEDSKGKSIVPNFTAVKEVIISEKGNLAKESRLKRREKARERTKEKMCVKQLNEARNYQVENRDCPLSSIFGYQQQNGSTSSSNVTENWDYNNFVSQSNQLYNILDQHKFIN